MNKYVMRIKSFIKISLMFVFAANTLSATIEDYRQVMQNIEKAPTNDPKQLATKITVEKRKGVSIIQEEDLRDVSQAQANLQKMNDTECLFEVKYEGRLLSPCEGWWYAGIILNAIHKDPKLAASMARWIQKNAPSLAAYFGYYEKHKTAELPNGASEEEKKKAGEQTQLARKLYNQRVEIQNIIVDPTATMFPSNRTLTAHIEKNKVKDSLVHDEALIGVTCISDIHNRAPNIWLQPAIEATLANSARFNVLVINGDIFTQQGSRELAFAMYLYAEILRASLTGERIFGVFDRLILNIGNHDTHRTEFFLEFAQMVSQISDGRVIVIGNVFDRTGLQAFNNWVYDKYLSDSDILRPTYMLNNLVISGSCDSIACYGLADSSAKDKLNRYYWNRNFVTAAQNWWNRRDKRVKSVPNSITDPVHITDGAGHLNPFGNSLLRQDLKAVNDCKGNLPDKKKPIFAIFANHNAAAECMAALNRMMWEIDQKHPELLSQLLDAKTIDQLDPFFLGAHTHTDDMDPKYGGAQNCQVYWKGGNNKIWAPSFVKDGDGCVRCMNLPIIGNKRTRHPKRVFGQTPRGGKDSSRNTSVIRLLFRWF